MVRNICKDKIVRKATEHPANTVRAKLAVREQVSACIYIRIQKKSLFSIFLEKSVIPVSLKTLTKTK